MLVDVDAFVISPAKDKKKSAAAERAKARAAKAKAKTAAQAAWHKLFPACGLNASCSSKGARLLMSRWLLFSCRACQVEGAEVKPEFELKRFGSELLKNIGNARNVEVRLQAVGQAGVPQGPQSTT